MFDCAGSPLDDMVGIGSGQSSSCTLSLLFNCIVKNINLLIIYLSNY